MSAAGPGNTPITLLIVDDHPVVRDGLIGMFAPDAGFEVLGEAADGAEAVRLALALRPSVILMDLRMPGMDGVAAITELAAREAGSPRLRGGRPRSVAQPRDPPTPGASHALRARSGGPTGSAAAGKAPIRGCGTLRCRDDRLVLLLSGAPAERQVQ